MRKKIEHELNYRIEGVDGSKNIEIDFVSNRIMKDYSEIVAKASDAERAGDRMSDLNSLIASEETRQEEGYQVKVEQYKAELKNCVDKIQAFSDNGFFEKRFEVLKRLLIDNGYKEDELMMSMDFWNDSVDPYDLIYFLTIAIYKDVDKKKVIRQ